MHLVGLCCVAFVAVAAFLVFDLDSKFYPKSVDGHSAKSEYSEVPNQMLTVSSAEHATLAQEPKPAQKQVKPARQVYEQKSRLAELEEKEFSLNLGGDAHVGITGMVKKSSLSLKFTPIRGTNMEQFQVLDARFVLGGTGIPITCIGAKIEQKILTMDFVSDSAGKFSVIAILDENILNDSNNKQSIAIEDQDFYLVKKEIPYKLNMIGTLNS